MSQNNRFASAMHTGESWQECVDGVVAALPGDSHFTLGLAYWTDIIGNNAEAILAALRERTGVEQWVGTVALGINGTTQAGDTALSFEQPALSVMLGNWPQDSFRVFAPLAAQGDEMDADTVNWIERRTPHVALVHADQNSRSLDTAMDSLATAMGGGFLIGGIGSSRGECPQFANDVVSGGLSGVMFADDVAIATRLSQGCSPIGARRTVTRGGGNVITEIDGRPALEVFKEDIGEVLARDLRRVAGYIFAGFAVPHSDTGEYLVRNLVGIDPSNNTLAVGAQVNVGDNLWFCRRDPQTAVDDMERMLQDIKRMLGERSPRAGVYVTCLARGPNQFEPGDLELTLIVKHLGKFPLTGFFANGEISNDRLYAYTGVLTIFF
jgi:small ligand-binding sensory domain FIST